MRRCASKKRKRSKIRQRTRRLRGGGDSLEKWHQAKSNSERLFLQKVKKLNEEAAALFDDATVKRILNAIGGHNKHNSTKQAVYDYIEGAYNLQITLPTLSSDPLAYEAAQDNIKRLKRQALQAAEIRNVTV